MTSARWRDLVRAVEQFADAYYAAPYRSALKRALRDEEDLIMTLVFAEALGVPNPVSFYTLELQPLMLERFHDWHRRIGLERSPLDNVRCC